MRDAGPVVRVRRATLQDADDVLAWRNDEDARRASFSSAVIERSTHLPWFARKLEDPACVIYIGVGGVGFVRFEREGDYAEISVAVAPERRGGGMGTALLRAACAQYRHDVPGVDSLVALVREDNLASRRAFERAGFAVDAHTFVGGAPALRMTHRVVDVLFRVEAGPGIGLGHVSRCASLAAALDGAGRQWRCLTADATALAEVVPADHIIALNTAPFSVAEAGEVCRRAASLHTACVVVDSYGADFAYLTELSQGPHRTAVIQDEWGLVAADVLIHPSVSPPEVPVSVKPAWRLVSGAEYILLRPDYWHVEVPAIRDTVGHVLLTFGGADPARLGVRLLVPLAEAFPAWTFALVVGPYQADAAAFREIAARYPDRITLVEGVATLRDEMLRADLAVTAAGQTLYELAACGRPAVAIEAAQNQHAQVEALARAGALAHVDAVTSADFVMRVVAAVRALAADPVRRRTMSAAARRMVDGQGATRVIHALGLGRT